MFSILSDTVLTPRELRVTPRRRKERKTPANPSSLAVRNVERDRDDRDVQDRYRSCFQTSCSDESRYLSASCQATPIERGGGGRTGGIERNPNSLLHIRKSIMIFIANWKFPNAQFGSMCTAATSCENSPVIIFYVPLIRVY